MPQFTEPFGDYPLKRIGEFCTGFLDGEFDIAFSPYDWEIVAVRVNHYGPHSTVHTVAAEPDLAPKIEAFFMADEAWCAAIDEKVAEMESDERAYAQAAVYGLRA